MCLFVFTGTEKAERTQTRGSTWSHVHMTSAPSRLEYEFNFQFDGSESLPRRDQALR